MKELRENRFWRGVKQNTSKQTFFLSWSLQDSQGGSCVLPSKESIWNWINLAETSEIHNFESLHVDMSTFVLICCSCYFKRCCLRASHFLIWEWNGRREYEPGRSGFPWWWATGIPMLFSPTTSWHLSRGQSSVECGSRWERLLLSTCYWGGLQLAWTPLHLAVRFEEWQRWMVGKAVASCRGSNGPTEVSCTAKDGQKSYGEMHMCLFPSC